MARIGFIGLGNMGGGMAANLARNGHDVRAFDLSEVALAHARDAGCLPVADATAAATDAEAVITMLPAGKQVDQVYRDSVFGVADTAAVLIDCSTIDVETTRQIADAASAKGLTAVDAPVSGGISGAEAGTLTFMVGGTKEGFERAQPFLSDMGKAVIHAGQNGTGQTAKMCNNMILGATMIATCEAFLMAKKLGLDPQNFYDIASVSTAHSWSMTSYCPMPGVGPESPADRDYAGGFATGLMLKDLRLAMDAAASSSSDTPIGARATELYAKFAESGHAGLDFSAIIKMLGDI